MEPKDLLQQLFQDELISANQFESLNEIASRVERVQKTLTYVYTCTKRDTFSHFCEALEQSGYEFISECMRNTADTHTSGNQNIYSY